MVKDCLIVTFFSHDLDSCMIYLGWLTRAFFRITCGSGVDLFGTSLRLFLQDVVFLPLEQISVLPRSVFTTRTKLCLSFGNLAAKVLNCQKGRCVKPFKSCGKISNYIYISACTCARHSCTDSCADNCIHM